MVKRLRMGLALAIERRKQEAKDKRIENKASTIAYNLGRREDMSNRQGMTGTKCEFTGEGLKIEHESGEVSGGDGGASFYGTRVSYKETLVFYEGGGRIYCFIPGKWEKVLERVYLRAVERGKEIDAQKRLEAEQLRAKEELEERAKWGL